MAKKKPATLNIQQVYDDLDGLWWDTVNDMPASGQEAYDRLFGAESAHARLEAADAARADYMREFIGQVHAIADFAVTSGHEAVAFFAGRVAGYAKVRQRALRELPIQIQAAEDEARHLDSTKAQDSLSKAREQLAGAMRSALKGWAEHRAWIYRSMFQELLKADPKASASQMLTEKRTSDLRKLVARRLPMKILQALMDAEGSMTRDALRDVIAPDGSGRSKEKRRSLNNYLTPGMSMVVDGLISVQGDVVTITEPGIKALDSLRSQ